jgi:hypothetical protein
MLRELALEIGSVCASRRLIRPRWYGPGYGGPIRMLDMLYPTLKFANRPILLDCAFSH